MNEKVCPMEKAGHLDGRFRRLVQNPKKILSPHIEEGMVVMDIGCGTGFFSVEIAKLVGKSGRVIAVDLQEGMLEKIRENVKGTHIEKRIKLHKCEENEIGFSEKIDFALAVYMVHEVPDQRRFFEEIRSLLKPNGKFLIIEPKYFHVSRKEFIECIDRALQIGFEPLGKSKVFLSRAVVLGKSVV
jgi:ubiquinone/menaquinone biosynthesis C-methylase UbiE